MTENHPNGIKHKKMYWLLRLKLGLASDVARCRSSANMIQFAIYFLA